MEKWAFYIKSAKFLGIGYIMTETTEAEEAKKEVEKMGYNSGDIVIWLSRDYC